MSIFTHYQKLDPKMRRANGKRAKMYVDISVHEFSGAFTRNVRVLGVDTQILLKVPAINMTTVRLSGAYIDLKVCLEHLFVDPMLGPMHVKAMKPLADVDKPPAWKNRWLVENRGELPETFEDL